MGRSAMCLVMDAITDTSEVMDALPGSFVVGIGGTLSRDSSSETALKLAMDEVRASGGSTEIFAGPDLAYPFYDPKVSSRTDKAENLISSLRRADALVIASPGYHGAISGMIKNALDYMEDLATDERVYLTDLPVGCITVAQGNQAAVAVLAELRTITHSLRGFPTPYGVTITNRPGLFREGKCTDPQVRASLRALGNQVVTYARLHGSQAMNRSGFTI
jgi:FMN reductase